MKRWAIDDAPTDAQTREIAELLRAGGIVLMPTDTIYGLHAVTSDSSRIADIKGRDESWRFVHIAASVDQLSQLGVEVPEALRAIWPAPLTAVMRSGASTIAARIPDLSWLRELLKKTGPLISTSANRSGEPPISTPNQLDPELQNRLDLLVDTGVFEGEPSMIVDFTGDEPRLVREGASSFAQKVWKRLRKSL